MIDREEKNKASPRTVYNTPAGMAARRSDAKSSPTAASVYLARVLQASTSYEIL